MRLFSLFIFLNNHVYGGAVTLSAPSAPDAGAAAAAAAQVQPRKGTALVFLHYGPQAAQITVAPVASSFDDSCLYVARTALVFERPLLSPGVPLPGTAVRRVLLLLSPPGGGKGTQGRLLREVGCPSAARTRLSVPQPLLRAPIAVWTLARFSRSVSPFCSACWVCVNWWHAVREWLWHL